MNLLWLRRPRQVQSEARYTHLHLPCQVFVSLSYDKKRIVVHPIANAA